MPDRIVIAPITLKWSAWTWWDVVAMDTRAHPGARVPNKRPGVYEVREHGQDERLTIGKAGDLRHRVKQGLVRGKAPHPAGVSIRTNEDVNRVEIRWALTERPAAVEEELHRRHRLRHGRLPRYTCHT
jgi:hypothetical protein